MKFTEFVKDYLYDNLVFWGRSFLFASVMVLLDHRYTLDSRINWSYNLTVFFTSFISMCILQVLAAWFEYCRKLRKEEKEKI